MRDYETVIGLEVHVELHTKTKIFCGCSTAFGGAPNTQTCPVCTGMPGSLPVLNEEVVNLALSVALALQCEITSPMLFDRKNYFYPDNPQNYQISQLYLPIGRRGRLVIDAGNGEKEIGITELHMEEDAGKLIHDSRDGSLVDFNRSGVPLVEIVSEPHMRSGEEVIAFLEKLRLMIRYLGASDCKLQEGSMRADVNLSVREKGSEVFGTRTEMKNLNSFKAILHAVEDEKRRQIGILEAGDTVEQETRRWDDDAGMSYSMRSKEDAKDYRYFPDPDLPPVRVDAAWQKRVAEAQPEFYDAKAVRYVKDFGLSDYDAALLAEDPDLAGLFEKTIALSPNPKQAANYLIVEGNRVLKEQKAEWKDLKLTPESFAELLTLLNDRKINQGVAKEVFGVICVSEERPGAYVESRHLGLVSDDGVLRECIERILQENPKATEEYLAGKGKAFGFLMGKTMQAMSGRGDPKSVRQGLEEALAKLPPQ